LGRRKLFSRDERVFCKWREIVIWKGSGFFNFAKKEENRVAATFSYQDADNIHVLEAAIRLFHKRGGERLSSLLEKE
jgi:hypothetical protein